MKIVILDSYVLNPGDLSFESIEELGELTVYKATEQNDEEIIRRIADSEVVITNKTSLNSYVINNIPNVKLICVLATGYNVVDIKAAKEKNIPVCNVPAYSTDMVAQHALSLLLEITDRVYEHSANVHKGKWAESPYFSYWDYPLIPLADKTIGIIGYGKIGQKMALICQSLGMNILSLEEHKHLNDKINCEFVSKDELLKRSDVISLHCPLTDDNKNLINKDSISKMRDGVILINTARGALINDNDLKQALDSGKVSACGIDVMTSEPPEKDNPLFSCDNCFITPHIAWTAKECRKRIVDITTENIKAYLEGKPVNQVN